MLNKTNFICILTHKISKLSKVSTLIIGGIELINYSIVKLLLIFSVKNWKIVPGDWGEQC